LSPLIVNKPELKSKTNIQKLDPPRKRDKRGFELDNKGHVICPHFPYPMMSFNDEILLDGEWNKIAAYVLGENNSIPLNQMLLTAKQEY